MVGLMPRSEPSVEEIARDIRALLALAGLPETGVGTPAGGYCISVQDDLVKVSWYTESGFYDRTGMIGLSHPQHPATRLDRAVISVMERAVADVLYAAGFTVVLRPGIDNTDPVKVVDPEVIVAAGPDFKAWTVLPAQGLGPLPDGAPAGPVSAAPLTQEQAQDIPLLVSKRAEVRRGALDPLPVTGGQVVLAVPGQVGARGVPRLAVPVRVGGAHFLEPFTHVFKVPAYSP